MHTDLSPHLHTPECNELIKQLKECHKENKFSRFLGICNKADDLVVKCLRNERKANQSKNLKASKERLARTAELRQLDNQKKPVGE